RRTNYSVAGRFHLAQRLVIACVTHRKAGPYREEVASGCPLLPLLHDALSAAAHDGIDTHAALLQRGEHVGHLAHRRIALAPVQNRQTFGAEEVRRMDHALLAVDLSEDHVQVDRGVFLGHHDHDDIGDRGVAEHQRHELVDCRRTGPLTESDHQQIRTQWVYVAAFERVVHPPLDRSVVQYPRVREQWMVREQRLHDQLFGPARTVPHGADHDVPAESHRGVASEEQVGDRRESVACLVERARERARRLFPALYQDAHHVIGREVVQVLGDGCGLENVHRLTDYQMPGLDGGYCFGKQVADIVHGREPLQHRYEAAVLRLGCFDVDDVVIQVVLARVGSDGKQLGTGLVHQYGAKRPDLGIDVDWHLFVR